MIYIIIPVFNRLSYTKDCLASLSNQSISNYKIVVVDHGSTDGTSEYIKNELPEVELITGSSDLWWTGAVNLGLKWVLETAGLNDTVLTLNNDLIVDKNYLECLNDMHSNFPKALIGSVSVDIFNPEKISFAGIKWSSVTAKYKSAVNINIPYSLFREKNEYIVSDLLPGRGTLIPVKAFKDVGIFDEENFPHYAADEDFSLRCKQAGYSILVATNACVKSYVNETGLNADSKTSVKTIITSLTSIKSKNNISKRWYWAKKHSQIPALYMGFYMSRTFFSYVKSLIATNNH